MGGLFETLLGFMDKGGDVLWRGGGRDAVHHGGGERYIGFDPVGELGPVGAAGKIGNDSARNRAI